MNIETVYVDDLVIRNRLRGLNEAAVVALVESIAKVGGIKSPIAIRWEKDEDGDPLPVLVAGHHRVEACKRAGVDKLPSIVVQNEVEARLWEISENLHRAELSVQERADHIAEWVRLTDERVSAHIEPKLSSRGRTGEGRPVGGINAAVRELGIERNEAQRAVKIASIAPDAREAADAAGLTTQSARLEIAKAEDQIAKVHELAERRASKQAEPRAEQVARSKPVMPEKDELDTDQADQPHAAQEIEEPEETEDDWQDYMMRGWNRAPDDWRDRFFQHALDQVSEQNEAYG